MPVPTQKTPVRKKTNKRHNVRPPQSYDNYRQHRGAVQIEFEKKTNSRRKKRCGRKRTVFKKAKELAIIDSGQVFVLFIDSNEQRWSYASSQQLREQYRTFGLKKNKNEKTVNEQGKLLGGLSDDDSDNSDGEEPDQGDPQDDITDNVADQIAEPEHRATTNQETDGLVVLTPTKYSQHGLGSVVETAEMLAQGRGPVINITAIHNVSSSTPTTSRQLPSRRRTFSDQSLQDSSQVNSPVPVDQQNRASAQTPGGSYYPYMPSMDTFNFSAAQFQPGTVSHQYWSMASQQRQRMYESPVAQTSTQYQSSMPLQSHPFMGSQYPSTLQTPPMGYTQQLYPMPAQASSGTQSIPSVMQQSSAVTYTQYQPSIPGPQHYQSMLPLQTTPVPTIPAQGSNPMISPPEGPLQDSPMNTAVSDAEMLFSPLLSSVDGSLDPATNSTGDYNSFMSPTIVQTTSSIGSPSVASVEGHNNKSVVLAGPGSSKDAPPDSPQVSTPTMSTTGTSPAQSPPVSPTQFQDDNSILSAPATSQHIPDKSPVQKPSGTRGNVKKDKSQDAPIHSVLKKNTVLRKIKVEKVAKEKSVTRRRSLASTGKPVYSFYQKKENMKPAPAKASAGSSDKKFSIHRQTIIDALKPQLGKSKKKKSKKISK